MRIHLREAGSSRVVGALTALTIGILAALAFAPSGALAGSRASSAWRGVASKLRGSVKAEAKGSYLLALARASALASEEAREAAEDAAKEEYDDEKALADDQYTARLDLAVALDETGLYTVAIDPADFVAGVDNPYMPLTPGTTRTYQAVTAEGTETIVVAVLAETKVILGVTCVVVRDTVSLDGVLVEDTYDWFAQDALGNVWYFGEFSVSYEDGEPAGVEGSWKAGIDGAQPGIVMPAARAMGDLYRQEFYLGEAEDYAEVLALNDSVSVPFGDYVNCLKTRDGTPMEPDAVEHKFYAQGIGVVLELNPETGERVELVSVTTN